MTVKYSPDDLINPANWWSGKEVAALIGVTQQSLYNMIDRGANLPPVHRRVGSTRLRFFKPEVISWMNDPKTYDRQVPAAQRTAESVFV